MQRGHGGRSGAVLVGQSKDLGFTLCEMGSPWRVLSRGGT